jgi:hypothetical protein
MIGTSQATRRWTANRLQAAINATTGAGAAPERNIPTASGIETKGPDGVTIPAADARMIPFHPDPSPNALETHSRGINVSASPATRNARRITIP